MDILNLIICVVGSNKAQRIVGRTQLQKDTYFVCEKLGIDCGFAPHYYGPYSRTVDNAVDTLVSVGFLAESEESFLDSTRPDSYFSRYTYSLRDEGKQILGEIKKKEPRTVKKIEEVMQVIERMGLSANYLSISAAAKTYCILKEERSGLSSREISKKARSFNWKISETKIDKVADFLIELDLAKRAGE